MDHTPIISENIRCRVPDAFVVGEGSIVDDYCYFSTQVEIGRFCHIANNVSIAGGKKLKFSLGDFSSVSAGVRIWCASDDFTRDMAALAPEGLTIPKHTIHGDVRIGSLTVIGCNSVIMPDNHIPEGVSIGALSFVPPGFEFEPWMVYAGIPLRRIGPRDQDEVLKQKALLVEGLQRWGEA